MVMSMRSSTCIRPVDLTCICVIAVQQFEAFHSSASHDGTGIQSSEEALRDALGEIQRLTGLCISHCSSAMLRHVNRMDPENTADLHVFRVL